MRAEFIETAFCGLERRFGPQHLHVVIDLDKSFSRQELEKAAAGAVEAFPILGCRFVKGFLVDRWLPDASMSASDIVEVEEIAGPPDEATLAFVQRGMDPEKGWPFRVKLLRQPAGSRLIIKVLHMAADGAGSLTIAEELGARLFGKARPSPPAPMDRGFWQVVRAMRLRDVPVLLLQTAGEFLRPLLIPFVAPEESPAAGNEPPRERYRRVSISGEDFRRLAERCRRLGCTINDALVAALAEVNKATTRRGIIGVVFTVDLRRYLPTKRPVVGNLSGVNIVVLPRSKVDGFERTAILVARRIGALKRRVPGLPFVLAQILLFGLLPRAVLRAVARAIAAELDHIMRRVLIVTNIGPMDEYLRPYGESVKGASVIGPFIRRLTAPVFVVTGFGDSLSIHACCCSDLPEERMDRLAEAVGRELNRPEGV